MASFVYNDAAYRLLIGLISWPTDTIRLRLVSAAVTPNKDDLSMTGYTDIGGGDQTLANCTITKDTATDRIIFDADDVLPWTAPPTGPTIGSVVAFKFISNDAGSIPIACIDVANVATNDTDVSAPFASTGVFYIQQ